MNGNYLSVMWESAAACEESFVSMWTEKESGLGVRMSHACFCPWPLRSLHFLYNCITQALKKEKYPVFDLFVIVTVDNLYLHQRHAVYAFDQSRLEQLHC